MTAHFPTLSSRAASLAALPIALVLAASPALAAPEDRGMRGAYLGAGGGVALGTGVDADGRSAGSHLGGGGLFRFGEEVLPGFTLGLAFAGSGGAGQSEQYEVGGGGLLVEAGWRPLTDLDALQLVFGTGVGGASLTPTADGGPEGAGGGMFAEVAIHYDFVLWGTAGADSLTLTPMLAWFFIPPSGELSEVSVSSFIIGVGTTWYIGR